MISNLTENKDQLNYSLLTSEIILLRIPNKKFNSGSWQTRDKFMNFAIELISTTIAHMIRSGYLFINSKELKPYKVLGITICTKEKYLIKHQEKTIQSEYTGWLEDKIFKQFYISNYCYLDKIVYNVLNDILNKSQNYTNPGKVFLLELIKNQKLNNIEFNQKIKWFSEYITITINHNLCANIKKQQIEIDKLNFMEHEILFIKKTVKKQLNQFQQLN